MKTRKKYYHRGECEMKRIKGWWFAPQDGYLANGDGRQAAVGITHTVKGKIEPCCLGLHLSARAIDALNYAAGPIVYRVEGRGTIVPHGTPVDKYACSEREYLAGGVDCSEALFRFARKYALDVVHLWDAPDVVLRFLKTGDVSLRDAAKAAACAADRDAAAAWAAAYAADRAAAYAADKAAAAARVAVWAAARDAAWDAAAAWAAAGDATRTAQNRRLTAMLSAAIRKKSERRGNDQIRINKERIGR